MPSKANKPIHQEAISRDIDVAWEAGGKGGQSGAREVGRRERSDQ